MAVKKLPDQQPEQESEAQRAVNYYKKRLDEMAGENLQKDYQISGLRKEVNQRRRAFTVLAEVQQTIGSSREISEIFDTTTRTINATLGMDRVFVLVPCEQENDYKVQHWVGKERLSDDFFEVVSKLSFSFPKEFATEAKTSLIVNKKTEPTPLIEQLRKELDLPYFACVPVIVEGKAIGLFLAGRLKEVTPVSPPLDQGDADTLQAVSGLISAVVQNMRVNVLVEMDRLKTDFFANLSHEFRTPITLTMGPLMGILAGRYGEVNAELKNQAEIMVRNQQRILNLINQILDLAKLESGKTELSVKRTRDMNAFIQKRIDQFRTMARDRGIELKSSFDPKVSQSQIYVDAEKMDKVIFNLLSNSHKFTKKGSIEVQTEIKDDRIFVRVKDTGIGIRADQLPYIFDRFRQADGSSSREHAGTGIGLALVKEMVKLHGGDITARSTYGEGTTFEFSIPLGHGHFDKGRVLEGTVEDDESESTVKNASQVVDIREGQSDRSATEQVEKLNKETEEHFQKEKFKVVFVDDNADLRTYVRDILKKEYNVFLGVNGKDGLEKIKAYQPDLILSDLMMPVMTGTELCTRVRQDVDLRGIPFVLLTAKSTAESKIEGLQEGADDYLNKPFSERELLVRIKNLITIRQQHLLLKRELQAARAIQQSLLPPLNQSFDNFRLEALYQPCEELSGDFFDTIQVGPWLYFYIADVTSHGTASAQVTYLIKSIFKNFLSDGGEPPLPDLMHSVAKRYSSYKLDYAMGLQVMRFNSKTQVLEYAVSNAPKAVLVGGNRFETLDTAPGPLLTAEAAVTDKNTFQAINVKLNKGESVYFFTDGCYEFTTPKNNQQFGYARFCKLLKSPETEKWQNSIFSKLTTASGKTAFNDDLTILKLLVGQQ